MRWLYGGGAVLAVVLIAGYFFVQNRLNAPVMTAADLDGVRATVAAQNETAFEQPPPQVAPRPAPNPLGNVYFGDLHSHSDLSFDSYIFGNRLSIDDAYRVAKGEAVETASGERVQLTVPLDFAAVTDHAEGFGLHEACRDPDKTKDQTEVCNKFESPSAAFFLSLRNAGEKRPPQRVALGDAEQARSTWELVVQTADQHNEPGAFTTFAAYEYSPPLPDTGKIHRNVIFRSSDVPDHAVSAFDALTEIDLWDQLSAGCEAPCEFLTIPHNPNKSWGLAFASQTIDGDPYTVKDWAMRRAVEPIVEMFQIKGNSECSLGFGATDEECTFEQFLPACEDGQVTRCIHPTSMVRDGLKKGLTLEEELGFNPLAFGMIGSTDTHNSNPGDAEEWDFRGASGLFSGTAKRRLDGFRAGNRAALMRNPGGLAAVWATENTRDALFDAMQKKTVYATSGTRISLRFYAGLPFDDRLLDAPDAVTIADATGVPMGATLDVGADDTPGFFVWALRDPTSAPLSKVQIVKGWLVDGEAKEQVFDVACSDGRQVDPQTHKCQPQKVAGVDLTNCAVPDTPGAGELKSVWRDPNFRADQNAFYYVRVVQEPSCRWSTYDSLRLGRTPPEDVPATVTEMAWSSPIWVRPD